MAAVCAVANTWVGAVGKKKHWDIFASGEGLGVITRTARGWAAAESWACQAEVRWLIGAGNTAKSREATPGLHPFVHALGSEMEQMESFIKEERVECGHRGSSARNSQVFSYCTHPSPRTTGCAVSCRGEGWGAAWLSSAIFHMPHPHLCIFYGLQWFLLKSQKPCSSHRELGPWEIHCALQQMSTGKSGGALGLWGGQALGSLHPGHESDLFTIL